MLSPRFFVGIVFVFISLLFVHSLAFSCIASQGCPEASPICSLTSQICSPCNATQECHERSSGSICDTNTGRCVECVHNAQCQAHYGSDATCDSSAPGSETFQGARCKSSAPTPVAIPDPNNINGIITAYTIICIVLFLLVVMFITCACIKDEDYGPESFAKEKEIEAIKKKKEAKEASKKQHEAKSVKSSSHKANGKSNGTANGKEHPTEDVEMKSNNKKKHAEKESSSTSTDES